MLIIDSCALIYLYHSDLLRYTTRLYKFVSIPEVLQELSVRATSKELQIYYQCLQIQKIEEMDTPLFSKKLSVTDKKLILLYNQHAFDYKGILSEDGKILEYCKKNSIPHYCCLSLVAELVKNNILTLEQAQHHMNFLLEIGRYAQWVIDYAQNLLESLKKNE